MGLLRTLAPLLPKDKLVTVTCDHCGNQRRITEKQAHRTTIGRASGLCRGCSRIVSFGRNWRTEERQVVPKMPIPLFHYRRHLWTTRNTFDDLFTWVEGDVVVVISRAGMLGLK